MTPEKISTPEVIGFDDLKDLAKTRGLCITIALAIPDPAQIRPRINNSLRGLQKSMQDFAVDERTASGLLAPIQSFASSVEIEGQWGRNLVLFRSHDVFRPFSVLDLARDFIDVGHQFQIRPLLSMVGLEQRFYVLALSRNHVRLLRATQQQAKEVPLDGVIPQSLQTWLNERIPDHVLDNRSSIGPTAGSMKGVVFGTSTDQERHNEHLAHFFGEIDSGVRAILGSGDIPLILAGVAEETRLYARVNTYPRLVADSIQGSPEKVSATELHERAKGIARHTFTKALQKALEEMKNERGAGPAITDARSILKAAHEGRVADLLFREDAELRGAWDETTQEIRPGEQDLLNLAALRTLSNSGRAFALRSSDLPEPASMAALLRF
jgi:hypothetical protein